MPRSSRRSRASRARSSIEYGPGGTGERPCPRWSYRASRNCAVSVDDLRIPHLAASSRASCTASEAEPRAARRADSAASRIDLGRSSRALVEARARGRRARPTTRGRWWGRERHRAPRAPGRFADRRGARRPEAGSSATRKCAAASRTISCASARPSLSIRRKATRSASTRPPVSVEVLAHAGGVDFQRLERARERSAARRRCSASAPARASHSACHAPAARSCSCSSDPTRTVA